MVSGRMVVRGGAKKESPVEGRMWFIGFSEGGRRIAAGVGSGGFRKMWKDWTWRQFIS